MLATKENTVRIEGILSEVDLKASTFKKNGVDVNSVGGVIKIRVKQKINSADAEETELEIPVHMFAAEHTNTGASNPAYESIMRIMNEYTSIAASDIDHATRVRITRGQLQMNEYYGQNGNLVSFPRITASFVNKIKPEECKPEASFKIVFMVGSKGYKLDKDGVETDQYQISGMVPQYGGRIDVMPFIAVNKGVIDAVSNYWNVGDTVTAAGKLNFSSKTETRTVEVDFGEPTEETRTISVSELVITSGSNPLEGDFAINEADVHTALAERKARLDELKEKSAAKKNASTTTKSASSFKEYGF